MDVRKKVNLGLEGLKEHGPVTIVAFGDSVTHGAFADGDIDYDAVYWNQFRKRINNLRNYIPVNVINAGIGGIDAAGSIYRIDSQVLKYEPDLVIVCFGLNDVNGPLERYLGALKEIFERCSEKSEVVFMTPNMLNTHVVDDAPERYRDYAAKTAEMQTNGRMDLYMTEAVKLAKSMNVLVCDCYSKWKELSETQDITMLLANRINHPTKEMHHLFADMLFETVFGKEDQTTEDESTMYKE